jgi:hypothetical protein
LSEREQTNIFFNAKGEYKKYYKQILVFLVSHEKGTPIEVSKNYDNFANRYHYYNRSKELEDAGEIILINKNPITYALNYERHNFLQEPVLRNYFLQNDDLLWDVFSRHKYEFMEWWDILKQSQKYFNLDNTKKLRKDRKFNKFLSAALK